MALVAQAPLVGGRRRLPLAGDVQRHRGLDVVPDVDVLADGPRDGAVGLLHGGDRGGGLGDLLAGQHAVDGRDQVGPVHACYSGLRR